MTKEEDAEQLNMALSISAKSKPSIASSQTQMSSQVNVEPESRVKFESRAQNRDYNRSPTSVGTFDVNGAAHVASRMLAAILLASKNGEFDRVLLGSSLQKLDYQ